MTDRLENLRPQAVVSTIVIDDTLAESIATNTSVELEKHRGYQQHQVCVMGDAASTTGGWDIFYVPDVANIRKSLSVDSGSALALSSVTSDEVTFTALLKGLVITQTAAGQTGVKLTFVISSSKGQLVNS